MIKFKQNDIIFDSQTIAGIVLLMGGLVSNSIPLSILGLVFYITK